MPSDIRMLAEPGGLDVGAEDQHQRRDQQFAAGDAEDAADQPRRRSPIAVPGGRGWTVGLGGQQGARPERQSRLGHQQQPEGAEQYRDQPHEPPVGQVIDEPHAQ